MKGGHGPPGPGGGRHPPGIAREKSMRRSYCGLCEECPLGLGDFQEIVSRLREYVTRFRSNWWEHCFPKENGFSFVEFRKALDWFLARQDCPGCQGGRGFPDCPIRVCAMERHLAGCYQCDDLEACDKFEHLLVEFPDVKVKLRRRQIKYRAQLHHQRLASGKKVT